MHSLVKFFFCVCGVFRGCKFVRLSVEMEKTNAFTGKVLFVYMYVVCVFYFSRVCDCVCVCFVDVEFVRLSVEMEKRNTFTGKLFVYLCVCVCMCVCVFIEVGFVTVCGSRQGH